MDMLLRNIAFWMLFGGVGTYLNQGDEWLVDHAPAWFIAEIEEVSWETGLLKPNEEFDRFYPAGAVNEMRARAKFVKSVP
jgi:hypothetical protein